MARDLLSIVTAANEAQDICLPVVKEMNTVLFKGDAKVIKVPGENRAYVGVLVAVRGAQQ